MASVSELSRVRGADARKGNSKSPGRRSNSAIGNVFNFYGFLILFLELLFEVFSLVFAKCSFASVFKLDSCSESCH